MIMVGICYGRKRQNLIFSAQIDNYDSFTWNLYQYLSLAGAQVTVYRSQDLTLAELIAQHPNPTHLVISPGPGHPLRDSGISIPAIKHYVGKLPILGVCMGLQCMYAAYGGNVDGAGEIIHGKTSQIMHDGRGLFTGIPQSIKSTRYHSLAGSIDTLPAVLEVTSRTKQVEGEKGGIVMGIRHKTYTMEAVQYHPESILSEEGKTLLANFLTIKGGLWSENPSFMTSSQVDTSPNSKSDTTKSGLATILEKIATQRTIDVAKAKAKYGSTPSDLASLLDHHVAPPIVPLHKRLLRQTPLVQSEIPSNHVALMAEVKRASPSKGDILPPESTLSSASIGLSYALAGASVISVLTEPKWFKGSLEDMRAVRQVVDLLPNRPAILRKDFILDPYQIDEARIYGADTVLLIVAMLDDATLKILYSHAQLRGMEPLVEVNNSEELQRALQIGAKVIGVNNRNLHDFQVDMSTTSKIADVIRKQRGDQADEVILCALSGITTREDVTRYVDEGVGAVLVGEALMRAEDKGVFVKQLLGLTLPTSLKNADRPKMASPPDGISSDNLEPVDGRGASRSKGKALTNGTSSRPITPPLVKICGMQTVEAALAAADAGADFIGLIFVEKSKSFVSLDLAREIISAVRTRQRATNSSSSSKISSKDWFSFQTSRLEARPKPQFVGVFQNEQLETVISIVDSLRLDLVQLHGDEPVGWPRFLSVPVIKAFHVEEGKADSIATNEVLHNASIPGYHAVSLLDTKVGKGKAALSGGAGKPFDWKATRRIIEARAENSDLPRLPIVLAGGLNCENVTQAIEAIQPWAVDISSGVKTDGKSNPEKIKAFLKLVKSV